MKKEQNNLPDGVYFISGGSESEVNTKTYAKYDEGMTAVPFPVKYIGVKLGSRSIAVSLRDLPGDEDGDLKLVPDPERCPAESDHYSCEFWHRYIRFNVFEDFDGKGNTERLKESGCAIDLLAWEWIPSMGEFGLLMMHSTDVNRAIELAGGDPIEEWHWSSTEFSRHFAWIVNFSSGYSEDSSKDFMYAVRTVTNF